MMAPYLEEPPEQWIAVDVILERPPFRSEFLLHTADEDALHVRDRLQAFVPTRPVA